MKENPYEPIRVFISSKQTEFAAERSALTTILAAVPLLAAVYAEDWAPQRALQERYLADVRRCPIYVGLFGVVYSEPTEIEYRAANENTRREILIYLKKDGPPQPRLADLLAEIKSKHVISKFGTLSELSERFEKHLWDAVSRMIAAYVQLSAPPPVPRSGGVSPLLTKWERDRKVLADLGLPGADSAQAASWWLGELRGLVERRRQARQ